MVQLIVVIIKIVNSTSISLYTARKYWCIFCDTAAVESQFVSPV